MGVEMTDIKSRTKETRSKMESGVAGLNMVELLRVEDATCGQQVLQRQG